MFQVLETHLNRMRDLAGSHVRIWNTMSSTQGFSIIDYGEREQVFNIRVVLTRALGQVFKFRTFVTLWAVVLLTLTKEKFKRF